MALTEQEIRKAKERVVYVAKRDGAIYGVWTNPPQEEHEAVYETDDAVQAFINRELPEPTPEQRLAAVGLTVDDLKTLLAE